MALRLFDALHGESLGRGAVCDAQAWFCPERALSAAWALGWESLELTPPEMARKHCVKDLCRESLGSFLPERAARWRA